MKETTETLTCSHSHQGPTCQRGAPVSEPKQGTVVDLRYLADGEVSGQTEHTVVIYSLSRID